MMAELNPKDTAVAPPAGEVSSTLEKPVYDPTAPSAIAVDHIVKKYGTFTAVDEVSFQVTEGEIFGLLGPNGAGKSTLIRMMTTLLPVTGGKAIIAGHDVSREPDAVRRAIGVIPQALTSDIDLTVEENLSIYAKLYEVPKEEREHNINDLLKATAKNAASAETRGLVKTWGWLHAGRSAFGVVATLDYLWALN